jgi:hypothetical protein
LVVGERTASHRERRIAEIEDGPAATQADEAFASRASAASAADCKVAGERALFDGQERLCLAPDGAASAEPEVILGGRAAVTADRLVTVECAPDNRSGGEIIEDSAASASIFTRAADGLVAEEAAVRGGEGRATFIVDCPSAGDIVAVPAECFVVLPLEDARLGLSLSHP